MEQNEQGRQEVPGNGGRWRLPPPEGWGISGAPAVRRQRGAEPPGVPTARPEPPGVPTARPEPPGVPTARGPVLPPPSAAPVPGGAGPRGWSPLPATPGPSGPGRAGGPGYGGPGYGGPGYGGPGYGGPGYGGPAGGPGGGGGSFGAPVPQTPGSQARSRRKRTAVVAVGILLVVAGLSSGITVALSASNSSQPAVLPQIPGPSTVSGVSTGNLSVSAIAARVDPAVVDIVSTVPGGQSDGTGMILTPSGVVVTNNHVINGATGIQVILAGTSQRYTAKVLGTDPTSDVALLQMQGASGLHTVSLGNSSSVTLGETVVAIGNAGGLGGTPTVTQGAITALRRTVTASDQYTGSSETLHGVFQTDALLQPGNSGGPLVNSHGQVVAMNTAALASSLAGQGTLSVGFAIPIDHVISVAQQIEAGRASSTVQIGSRGFMGVAVESVSTFESNPSSGFCNSMGGFGFGGAFGYVPPARSGSVVVCVVPNSPAQHAGLAVGDVIVSLNGQNVGTAEALTKALSPTHPGDTVTVGWIGTGGQSHSASIRLGTGPAD